MRSIQTHIFCVSPFSSPGNVLRSAPTKDDQKTGARLTETRQRLFSDRCLYLGSRAVRDKVEWLRVGSCDKLIWKPEAPFELADLAIVGNISDEDFFFTADAGWRPGAMFAPSLEDSRASASLGAPDVALFAADFPEALENIRYLQNVVAPGTTSCRGPFTGPDEAPRVKIRHIFFEVCSMYSFCFTEYHQPILGPEFQIDNWPAYSKEGQAAVERMARLGTHKVIPLPAYDMHGDLINPRFYRARLQGALVELHFSLTHWRIGSKKESSKVDVFVAELDYLRVLVPPKPTPVTPRKRKVSAVDPTPSPSPSKRSRMSSPAGPCLGSPVKKVVRK
ncbi:hypothetical protein K466DRAFT_503415 [Polyporus arcularius HHB13444]|uniref:Uncharacterized protein n=1 Tax=Polyporus arcularius HHB13444 TaxID=1314778 RepID=A0A5C3NT68_9APHY|nr:hypothetical protein K466DRAFT_503415 [Polyporus arcularius HHB13444]